jgi:hypothetical protein
MIIKAKTNKNVLSHFKREEPKKAENPKKIALVCIAKNEDNYIQEWVSYHKKIGFDDVFVYQNNWRCLVDTPNLIKIEFDGDTKQIEAYNHFIQNYKHIYEWAAFFDVDEFLVLKKHGNVKDFIEDYFEYSAVAINWFIFGCNGHEMVIDGNYNVLERFTMRQANINPHIKCIVNIRKEDIFMKIHDPDCSWVDTSGKINYGYLNHEGNDEIAQINHYFTKTKEEFIKKVDRGRADEDFKRSIDEFYYYNNFCNEVEDLGAYNFFKN